MYAVAYLRRVAYYSYLAALCALEVSERLDYHGEAFVVEVAESFVDKEASYCEVAAREGGEAEGEAEADDEGFAAREARHGAFLVAHVSVYYFEPE